MEVTKIHGLDTLESDVSLLAQKVGYVYQDFENQIVRPTVLDDASYACLNYAFPDYLDRGAGRPEAVRSGGPGGEYVWQLSGGQTHLLALAGAVSLQGPDILILDEPIAQLDPMHADRIYGCCGSSTRPMARPSSSSSATRSTSPTTAAT